MKWESSLDYVPKTSATLMIHVKISEAKKPMKLPAKGTRRPAREAAKMRSMATGTNGVTRRFESGAQSETVPKFLSRMGAVKS